MRHLKLNSLALALAAGLLVSACATPSSSAAGGSTITIGGVAATRQEAADAELLDAATNAFQDKGYAALAPHLGKLRAALDRAPASYPAIESRPDGSYIVRASDMMDGLILSAAVSASANKGANVVQGANVYPMIALMLGSYAVEQGDFKTAHAYLDRGLAMQPEHWMLLAEKASAYVGERKWQAALDLADKSLASDDLIIAMHSDALLRKRGYALVELDRLDEARAAYQKALEANEDDEVSKNELDYINQLIAKRAPANKL